MPIDALLHDLLDRHLASRIWRRDLTAFGGPDAPADVQASVRTRLGWLDVPTAMTAHQAELDAFAAAARRDGLTDVYLLGMGGSSLCAEVLRDVPLARADGCRLVVLDTTDEATIRDVTATLVPERALFLVSSKSGTTIEVTSLERHFWSVVERAGQGAPGQHFTAISDPGTPLVSHAAARGYRQTFVNPPDIGGRYSALSLFGLVPGALLGLNIAGLLASARQMADRCRHDHATNPGLALGAFLAGHARAGRDKLTLLAPPALAPLGAWIEQLIAESTGKHGHGLLPVVDEPIGSPDAYGADRLFVALVPPDATDLRAAAERLATAGQPVLRIETTAADLGAEFFRWEFATAVTGAALDINPFDEPNVRDAKMRTQAQLDTRTKSGAFHVDPPLVADGVLSKRAHRTTTLPGHRGRYIAILDYLSPDASRTEVVSRIRADLRRRFGLATTHGRGPRYLHSTGQYHKGGPNTGTFLLVTGADASTTPVPGTAYTFSMLKQAQALGDFEALMAAGRDVVHVQVDDPAADRSAMLETIAAALE
jgi:glucose-6-phosphate isomerase